MMGNHTAGANIVDFASLMYEGQYGSQEDRLPKVEALAILERAVNLAKSRSDWSPDTEFDDAPYEDGVFRNLLISAFGDPDIYYDGLDDEGDSFYDRVYGPFNAHFGMR